MLTELIERVEKAEPKDRELDVALFCLFNPSAEKSDRVGVARISFHGGYQRRKVPFYTGSIDAALTLIPATCDWSIEQDACWIRWLGKDDVEKAQGAFCGRGGKSTALAICLAVLRARSAAAQEHQEGESR